MVNNPPGECSTVGPLSWPLNQCQKRQLLGLTSQLLERYSNREQYEYLPCQLDVQIHQASDEKNQQPWSLLLNGEDHFEHFYHNGYLLNSLKIKDGVFIMLLDDEAAITKHLFIKHGEESSDELQSHINDTDGLMLVIKTDVTSPTNSESPPTKLAVEMYKNQQKLWSKQTDLNHLNAINLCQQP